MSTAPIAQSENPPEHLQRQLGLFSASTMVTGVVIGSGIFIVSADIARQLSSPGLLMAVWIFTGILTLLGAISFSKLAAAYPLAGGQYVFLKKAWGEIPAFLYGIAMFFVIQTGTLTAVAVGFTKFLGVLLPSITSPVPLVQLGPHFGITTEQTIAMSVLTLLTLYNCLGVKEGAWLQNIFTVLKVAAIIGLIIVGFVMVPHGLHSVTNHWFWKPLSKPVLPFWSAFAVATVGSVFAADAWNNVTFIGSEIKNPRENLPKAMIYGVCLVLILYFLVNAAYINLLPFNLLQHAPADRVATAAMNQLFGGMGAAVMAGVILISTFGCLNGMILAGARVYYAMAQDNLFFHSFGRLSHRFKTPVISLVGQGILAIALTLVGSYGQLLDFITFTTLLFYILTACGLLRLKKLDPDKIKLRGFWDHAIPIGYIAMLTYICINLALYKSAYSLGGLAMAMLGIPLYFIWKATHRYKSSA